MNTTEKQEKLTKIMAASHNSNNMNGVGSTNAKTNNFSTEELKALASDLFQTN